MHETMHIIWFACCLNGSGKTGRMFIPFLPVYSITSVARTSLDHENIFVTEVVRAKKVKVKVSHSLIAVGAVGVRVPLYLGHS